MISDINIRDINHVQEILNDIRNYVKAYENQIGELSEDVCENIGFQLARLMDLLLVLKSIRDTIWRWQTLELCHIGNILMENVNSMNLWRNLKNMREMFDKKSELCLCGSGKNILNVVQ